MFFLFPQLFSCFSYTSGDVWCDEQETAREETETYKEGKSILERYVDYRLVYDSIEMRNDMIKYIVNVFCFSRAKIIGGGCADLYLESAPIISVPITEFR